MNVSVKHEGDTVTGWLISYRREHKICTGIGELEIVFDRTIPRTFDPWDTIDIHENGDFQVRYYVSDVNDSVPDGTITLSCQDISKRLVDYFIPQTYTIDYPSFTRDWIEQFLDEAGLTYQFTTSSRGNLLSNYTTLGLQPAYEQIIMLLQMSGWYMYFDGNGKAIIGTLDTDLASSAGTINNTDILKIAKVEDDKMLRNRAVVWGAYDYIRQQYAFADISTHTRWNYDRNDLRAMVISNSNIPTRSAAYGIANKLLKEFARITVEKHIEIWGAREYSLGKALRVNSGVWRGKGLITTFGVTLDRNGLITHVTLDERCPRLFGYFNFGDYVYVGTFGDGIWRKRIRFDPTWYNFSSGLTDLNITDLHINNGVFGAVGHSGALYYNNAEDGSWNSITVTGLDSSVEDAVPSGQTVVYGPFSGIMARATIVDKTSNTVKFGLDTWSGLNTGDYFLTFSGMVMPASGITFSGVSISGGHRGWITEHDPVTGQLVGGLGSGIYPIHYSGNYDVTVLDLENDGVSDYVSIRLGGQRAIDSAAYAFGTHDASPFETTRNSNTHVGLAVNGSTTDAHSQTSNTFSMPVPNSAASNLVKGKTHAIAVVDNPLFGERVAVSVGNTSAGFNRQIKRIKLDRVFDVLDNRWEIQVTANTTNNGFPANVTIIGIHPEPFFDKYTVFYTKSGGGTTIEFYYIEWNATTNTFGSETLITSNNLGTGSLQNFWMNLDGFIYYSHQVLDEPSTVGGFHLSPTTLNIDLVKINKATRGFEVRPMLRYETPPDGTFSGPNPRYFFMNESSGVWGNDTIVRIFQNGSTIQIIGWLRLIGAEFREYVLLANEQTFQQPTLVYQGATDRFPNTNVVAAQVTTTKGFIGLMEPPPPGAGTDGFIFDGQLFKLINDVVPELMEPNIYPVLGSVLTDITRYIIKDGSNWYTVDTTNYEIVNQIIPPANYTIGKPFSNCVDGMTTLYMACTDFTAGLVRKLVPYNVLSNSFDTSRELSPPGISSLITTTVQATNIGGFFLTDPTSWTIGAPFDPNITVTYLDLGLVEFGGGFLVLQREGMDYNLIQSAAKPIRIDQSLSSPLLTVQDLENTFITNYVFGDSLTQIVPISGLLSTEVRDYRYTMLETTSGVVTTSGGEEGIGKQILYVYSGGLMVADIDTYSGGFTVLDASVSGLERLETSNYVYPGQYIFVTTSGDNPQFYQRDANSMIFTHYSGLPDSRATIIRVDDRF